MAQSKMEIRIRVSVNDFVQRCDPRYTLDPEAEELMNDLADEFIASVTRQACSIAALRHREHEGDPVKVEKTDLYHVLQHEWGIMIENKQSRPPMPKHSRSLATYSDLVSSVNKARVADRQLEAPLQG